MQRTAQVLDGFVDDYICRKNSKQNQNTRNESREKERKQEQEMRGDAEEPTETRRAPQRRAARWGERAKPTGRRRVPGRKVGEEPKDDEAESGADRRREVGAERRREVVGGTAGLEGRSARGRGIAPGLAGGGSRL